MAQKRFGMALTGTKLLGTANVELSLAGLMNRKCTEQMSTA